MATVIDAFLVTLGLDNKEFKAGAVDAEKVYEDLTKKAKAQAKDIVKAAKGKSKEEIEAAREKAKEVLAAEKKAAKAISDNLKKTAQETADKLKEQSDRGKAFFQGMATSALEFFGVMAAFGMGASFIKETVEAQVAAGRLAKTLNVDVVELEGLQGAVKRFGGSTEGMDQSLKGLNSRLQLIAIHGPRSKMALQIFAGMGISEVALKGKDATQVMGLLAEKMKDMSGAKAMALGERLGLDEATVRMLQTGKENVDKLTAGVKDYAASKEDVEKAEKLEQSMLKIKGAIGAVGRGLMAELMPALVAMGEGLAKVAAWAKSHGPIIKAALVGVGVAALFVASSSISAGIAAGIAWVAALGPLNLLVGAIALVAAGITWVALEFRKWASGGESVLSGFFTFFKGIWESIRGTVMTVFYTLKDIIMTFFAILKDEWDFVVAIFSGNGDKIKAAFKKLCKDIGHLWGQMALLLIYELLRAFFMIEHAGANLWKGFKDAAKKALEWIWEKVKAIGKIILRVQTFGLLGGDDAKRTVDQKGFDETLARIKAYNQENPVPKPSAAMAMKPSVFGDKSVNSTRETHIGSITVQTQATDAQGIAKDMHGAIQQRGGLVDQADGGF